MAACRHADEVFAAADRKGLLTAYDQDLWKDIIGQVGLIHICTYQLESARACFARILAWPGRLALIHHVNALCSMAACHKACDYWDKVIESCEEALTLIPSVTQEDRLKLNNLHIEERLFIYLADAAEAQGHMEQAHEYDDTAKRIWQSRNDTHATSDFVSCNRRYAVELLAAGQPVRAISFLKDVPASYGRLLSFSGINFLHIYRIKPHIAALRVLVDGLVQAGLPDMLSFAGIIRADVEETEAIIAGYQMGVLEETRWELAEKRRAVAASGATGKKSKAAKRKQKKRKAQQQRKAAEIKEAAAAAATARGEEVRQGRDGIGMEPRQEEHGEEREQENQENQEGNNDEQAVLVAAAALAAMAVGGTEGQEEEDEEEEECSVRLNAIEGDDTSNPAGPPLPCGHRYHAFCLHFWDEKCMRSASSLRARTAGRRCRK